MRNFAGAPPIVQVQESEDVVSPAAGVGGKKARTSFVLGLPSLYRREAAGKDGEEGVVGVGAVDEYAELVGARMEQNTEEVEGLEGGEGAEEEMGGEGGEEEREGREEEEEEAGEEEVVEEENVEVKGGGEAEVRGEEDGEAGAVAPDKEGPD